MANESSEPEQKSKKVTPSENMAETAALKEAAEKILHYVEPPGSDGIVLRHSHT
jgi:hypothetical protein